MPGVMETRMIQEVEEVYLWRGSDAQRALRSMWGKSGRFGYFSQQLGHLDWSSKVVLDFGGNEGNLLMDDNCTIRPENYCCLDVIREALELGRQRFPQAQWVHYNRYNCSFNPEGKKDEPIPDLAQDFDVILAYSVFTHTTREEMHCLVEQLHGRLAPGGMLAFTFIDPHFRAWPQTYRGNNLQWRLEKTHLANPGLDVAGLLEKSRRAAWCSLVGGSELYVDSNGSWHDEAKKCLTYNVYYSAEFMQQEFPEVTILRPVSGEMQHCCVMRKG